MAPVRILVVEDSPTMRQLIYFALKPIHGLEIIEAGDGLEGLKKLNQEKFDMALIDINMPLMDGLKLIRMMKEDPGKRNIPVIIISTEGGSDTQEKAMALGVNAYITKPIQAGNVLRTVKEILNI